MNDQIPPVQEPKPAPHSPMKVPPQVPGPDPDAPDLPGRIPSPKAPVEEPDPDPTPAF